MQITYFSSSYRWIIAVALLSIVCGPARSDDWLAGFHGYVRAGYGENSEHDRQSCFGLPGISKYRLGNECDFYGEVGYSGELAKLENGSSFAGTIMESAYNPKPSINEAHTELAQLMIEAKKLPLLNGGTVWVGKRYYNRPDIHIIDTKYVQLDGTGIGVDGIPSGPGKFSYAIFRNNLEIVNTSIRHNLIYQDLPTNTNGKMDFYVAVIRADSTTPNGHNGWSLSIIHNQDKILGGNNTVGLQYGVGPGIGNGLSMGSAGSVLNDSSVTRSRMFDSLYWQPTAEWGGMAILLTQRDKNNMGTQTWNSIGSRISYALSENFKLQLEIGHDRLSPATGGNAQQLTKITFAPTLTKGKNFWTRPELRAFVTYAKWNRATQNATDAIASGDALSSTGAFGNSLHGCSIGIQAETWF